MRKWCYETFGDERAVEFTVMATPEDLSVHTSTHLTIMSIKISAPDLKAMKLTGLPSIPVSARLLGK